MDVQSKVDELFNNSAINSGIKVDEKQIVSKIVGSDYKKITGFELEDGTTISYNDTINAVKQGRTFGLVVQNNNFGEYIKTNANNFVNDNLMSLPTMKDSVGETQVLE